MKRRKRDRDQLSLFGIKCEVCSRPLVPTESGYVACPNGHGRLCLDAESVSEEPCGSLFDTLAHEEG